MKSKRGRSMTSDKTANRGEKKTDISYIQKDDHRRVTYYKRANSLLISEV